jgi:hypothetical protein
MSHRPSPLSAPTYKHVTEYSPSEYKRLRKRKNSWAFAAMAPLFGGFFLLMFVSWVNTLLVPTGAINAYVGLIAIACVLLMGLPILLVAIASGEAHNEFRKIAKDRAFVLEALAVAVEFAKIPMYVGKRAHFTIKVEGGVYNETIDGTEPYMLKVLKDDTVVYEYHMADRYAATLYGPELSTILPALKALLAQDVHGEAIEKIEASLSSAASRQQAHGASA